jgi:carbamoyl-phosphate synthase large subunit
VGAALRLGVSLDEVFERSKIDPWFLHHIAAIVDCERAVRQGRRGTVPGAAVLGQVKRNGISDARIAQLCGVSEEAVRARRLQAGIRPVYKRIDTCAAEFEAHTPYLYSTYEQECEAEVSDRKKVVILGGGPNRIGQGIEFDYCCVHAAFALREAGYETIMVNCNPETVSTDYDTSDRLYFEPLTAEHVLEVLDAEARKGTIHGVLVQFGGQTPLKLAKAIEAAGYPLLGTPAESIDLAEDRERFGELLSRLRIDCPRWGVARSADEAFTIAHDIGYPVLVRPSYVLGGRAMEIVHSDDQLDRYMREAVRASPDHPVLIDEFLPHATEFDVDAVADGQDAVVAGIMEHIEEAGVHSGDSSCSLPPVNVSDAVLDQIRSTTATLARELGVIGLMNIQFALRGHRLYVIEVNPRGSRTVPFVSKAQGVPYAKIAARVAAGESLSELGVTEKVPEHVSVKFPVFPFRKFPGVDTLLGPEMRSTGEVMGIGKDFGTAYMHAVMGEGAPLPLEGAAMFSVMDDDKDAILPAARSLHEAGFTLVATGGTAEAFRSAGLPCTSVLKVWQGRPHTVDAIKNGDIKLVVNTSGISDRQESFSLRRTTLLQRVPYFTTVSGALAAAHAISTAKASSAKATARALQDYHGDASTPAATPNP